MIISAFKRYRACGEAQGIPAVRPLNEAQMELERAVLERPIIVSLPAEQRPFEDAPEYQPNPGENPLTSDYGRRSFDQAR
jgi:hypothetical protein